MKSIEIGTETGIVSIHRYRLLYRIDSNVKGTHPYVHIHSSLFWFRDLRALEEQLHEPQQMVTGLSPNAGTHLDSLPFK